MLQHFLIASIVIVGLIAVQIVLRMKEAKQNTGQEIPPKFGCSLRHCGSCEQAGKNEQTEGAN